jgi:hypothetical protein
MQSITNFILFIILSFVISCGEVNEGKGNNQTELDKRLQDLNCPIQKDNFKNILKLPIESDIECAYKKINFLIDSIVKERPELEAKHLSSNILKDFIRSFAPSAVDFIEYVDLFYELNQFVFGSDHLLLYSDDFLDLKKFALNMNAEFSRIHNLFEIPGSNVKVDYVAHKKNKQSVNDALTKIFIKATDPRYMDLYSIMSKKKRVSPFDINQLFIYFNPPEWTQNALFLKKLFLGGEQNILLRDELKVFLEKKIIPISTLIYDLVFYFQDNIVGLNTDLRYAEFSESILKLKKLITADNELELISFDSLVTSLKNINENWTTFNVGGNIFRLSEYKNEILRVKEIFLNSKNEMFNVGDIKHIVDLFYKFASLGEGFSKHYKINLKYLEKDTPEVKMEKLTEAAKAEHFSTFKDVLRKYRYFQNGNGIPTYGNFSNRNLSNIIFVGQMEFLLNHAIEFYRKTYPCDSSEEFDVYNYSKKIKFFDDYLCSSAKKKITKSLSVGQIYFFILEFRKLFHGLNIIKPGREDRSAENVALIPDLFIHSANDNGMIESNELLEFFMMIADSVKLRNNALSFNEMAKGNYKRCLISEGLYDSICIREKFPETLGLEITDGKSAFDFLPQFKKFYEKSLKEANIPMNRYVLTLEGYTKSCPYDNVPYNLSDIMGLYTGLFSVEATINRFDKNYVNDIEPHEVPKAYEHFYNGIEAIVVRLLGWSRVDLSVQATQDEEPNNWFGSLRESVETTINRLYNYRLKTVVKLVFKYLLKYKDVPYPLGFDNIKGLAAEFFNSEFGPVDRETIAQIIIILQKYAEQARVERYAHIGDEDFIPNAQYCASMAIPRISDPSELEKKQWQCIFEQNCE